MRTKRTRARDEREDECDDSIKNIQVDTPGPSKEVIFAKKKKKRASDEDIGLLSIENEEVSVEDEPSAAVKKQNEKQIRPANNQLLYRARFSWEHYPKNACDLNVMNALPKETNACASVSSAFLQTMRALQLAERNRKDGRKRNALKLLAKNTRRTKVVQLSGVVQTHRVPDELRKHNLNDKEDGVDYGTNLDRNRYGLDTDYLHTCCRYNVNALGLCPKIVNIEIVDSKLYGGKTRIVRENDCSCQCEDVDFEAFREKNNLDDPMKLVWPKLEKKHGNHGNRNRSKNTKNEINDQDDDANNNNNSNNNKSATVSSTAKTIETKMMGSLTKQPLVASSLITKKQQPTIPTTNPTKSKVGEEKREGNLGFLLDALKSVGGINVTPHGTPQRSKKKTEQVVSSIPTTMKPLILENNNNRRNDNDAIHERETFHAFSKRETNGAMTPNTVTTINSINAVGLELSSGVDSLANPLVVREAIEKATLTKCKNVPNERLRDDLHDAVVRACEFHISATIESNRRKFSEMNASLLAKEVLALREELRKTVLENADLKMKQIIEKRAMQNNNNERTDDVFIEEAVTTPTKAGVDETITQTTTEMKDGAKQRLRFEKNQHDTNHPPLAQSSTLISLQDTIRLVKERLERALESDLELTKKLYVQECEQHTKTLLRLLHCEVILDFQE